MAKVQMLIEVEYDKDIWYSDADEQTWFKDLLLNPENELFLQDVGDYLGKVKVLNILGIED